MNLKLLVLNKKQIIYFPEILFTLYFWGFILLRPVLQFYENYSTLILFFYVLFLFTFLFINQIIDNNKKINKSVILIFIFFIFFLFDSILRYNKYSFTYLYKFIYTGIIPIIFLSNIQNISKLLIYNVYFSIICFFIYGFDPINGFGIFKDYMDYGFNLALPSFLFMYIGYKYFRFKWILPLLLTNFTFIFIFANRSSILAVIIFIILYYFLFIFTDIKKIIKLFLPLVILIFVLTFNSKYIIQFTYNIVTNIYKINSYSLNKFTSYFQHPDNVILYSGREEIWNKSLNMIKENIFFGSGIGSFQSKFGFYSHNIFLDLLLFFGLIGLIIFTFFIIFAFINIYSARKYVKSTSILGIIFLSLWFPKLFFSTHFLEDIGFWCFITFPFMSKFFVINKSTI